MGFMRNALYSFDKYEKIPKDIEQIDNFVKELWNDKVFRESVFLASYELYSEWEKLCQEPLSSVLAKKNKINNSILKYYIRITTRSTPFGTFASHSAFEISKENKNITEEVMDSVIRTTSIDLSFLFQVITLINRNFFEIHDYCLNDSIYKFGNHYRYIETTLQNNKRVYTLTSLEQDDLLNFLYKKLSDKYYSFDQLIALVNDSVEGVTEEEVKYYVTGLIEAQFFKSKFDICLSEPSPLRQLIDYLNAKKSINKDLDEYLTLLKKLEEQLEILNSGMGQSKESYDAIYALANMFSVLYDRKHLINSSLKRNLDFSPVTKEDLSKISKAIEVLSCFWNKETEIGYENLENFKKKFYYRYEEKLVKLVDVLDNESGIGYVQEQNSVNDFSPLLDTLTWPNVESDSFTIAFNKKTHEFWRKIINNTVFNGKSVIDLSEHNIKNLRNSEQVSLSKSFTVMFQKTADKIVINSVGGTSGINIIARFSNEDEKVLHAINEIIKQEQQDEHFIYAELLHLPDNRVANILLRNVKRGNQFSYLSKASTSEDKINLCDLYIKMINNRIVLIHKVLKKEVKIFHSNAHNYEYNSLPLYQFLCDLQKQDISTGLSLNVGEFNYLMHDYIPRITFGKDIIFTPALWRVYKNEIMGLDSKDDLQVIKNLREHLSNRNIAKYFFISQGDHKLMIDFQNDNLMIFVVEELRSKEIITLTECLYDLNVDKFNNEIILPLINKNHLVHKTKLADHAFKMNIYDNKFIPGNKWFYYKIYCGTKFSDKILKDDFPDLLTNLKNEESIKKWFYIRYSDPDNHIRLRLEINDNDPTSSAKIISVLNSCFNSHINEGIISKIEMGTYDREYERYEGEFINIAESIFHHDSLLTLNLLKNISNADDLWLYAIKTIDTYFNIFNIDLDTKYEVAKNLSLDFQREFNVESTFKKQVDSKYRNCVKIIDEIIEISEYDQFYTTFTNSLSKNRAELERLNSSQKKKLIVSFIHMHINRLLKSRHRMHELLIYGIIEKYYKMKIGKRKYLVS